MRETEGTKTPTREDHILRTYICVYPSVQDMFIIEAQSFPEPLHELVALWSCDNVREVAANKKTCPLSDDVGQTAQMVLLCWKEYELGEKVIIAFGYIIRRKILQ